MEQLTLVQDLAVVLLVAGAAAWLCQRLGVSVVVGYLVAGIVIGPFTPPFSLVTSVENVHHLANLGLIFVMFFVGLGLSLPRLRSLGLPAIAATVVTALTVLTASRLAAGGLGLGLTGGLFLGGILVVSSSAIIDKVLEELDSSHEPWAQLAMGITVLEDMVAVAMLAILGSLASASTEQAAPLPVVMGKMTAFVLVVLIVCLLAVPRLLRRLRKSSSADVETVWVAGLVLALAWIAARAGYSIALGAFLIGSSLGGTQHKAHLERAFQPVRDMFAAVFFVSMGMLFDVSVVATEWPWVLALTAFALLTRFFAASIALVLVGQPLGDSVRVGLSLLPLGEFSFVIAQLGVASGLMPPAFYPAAVGAALITTLLSPPLMRRGGAAADSLSRREPQLLRAWRALIVRTAAALQRRRERKPVFRLLSGRAVQLLLEVALVVSAVASSRMLYGVLARALAGSAWSQWLLVIYWTAFGVMLLVPLLAIWRNLGALGMILGEAAVEGRAQRRMQPVVERLVQFGGGLAVLLLCAAFLPRWHATPWVMLAIVAAGVLLTLVMRAPLVRWYALAQTEVRENLAALRPSGGPAPLSEEKAERTGPIVRAPFGLKVREHVISDTSPAAGESLGSLALRSRFGCTLAGLERQGITVASPGSEARLYPNDLLLLVGTREQLDEAEAWLNSEAAARPSAGYSDLVTETLQVPPDAPYAGRTLAQLAVASRFGVQVLGLSRQEQVFQITSGDQTVERGDALFVLGSARQNAAFRKWLESAEGEQAPG